MVAKKYVGQSKARSFVAADEVVINSNALPFQRTKECWHLICFHFLMSGQA